MPDTFEIAPRAVARVAGWPLEALDGLRSPGLVDEIRALHAAAERLRADADSVCDRLGAVVPELADRADRRLVLGLRRALHRDVAPVAADPRIVAVVGRHGVGLPEHLAGRVRLAERSAAAREEYERCVEQERAAFLAVATTAPFGRALAVGAPALAGQWATDREAGADRRRARIRRRELAVVGHLLRAAGRPTPSGLWAGVARVEPGDDDATEGLLVRRAEGSVAVVPDVGPWLAAARRRAGSDATVHWPVGDGDPWDALALLGAALPGGSEQARWRTAVAAARAAADRLAAALADGSAEDLLALGEAIRSAFASVADDGEPAPPSVVRVDRTMPFELRWTAAERARHAEALAAVARFAALDGGPELWRTATGARPGLAPGTTRRLEDAVADAEGPRPVGPFARPDRVSAFLAFGDDAVTEAAWRCAQRWEAQLEPHHRERAVDLPCPPAAVTGVGLGPAGSVLVEPSGRGIDRYLGLRPGPDVYRAGHRGIGPAEDGPVEDEVPRVTIVAADPANPTVGFGAPARARALDLRAPLPAGAWSIRVDAVGRAWLVDEAGDLHVPEVPHLAAVGRTDPASALLQAAASSFGGTVPAAVFPMLPAEWERWRHLPELRVDGEAMVARERWVLGPEDLEAVGRSEGFDRFAAWVALADRLGLPATVTARVGGSPNEAGRVVPVDSVLAVETLFHDPRTQPPHLVVEAGPDVGDTIALPGSGHHVVQLAIGWRDRTYWDRMPPPWGDGDLLHQVNVTFATDAAGPQIDWPGLDRLVRRWQADGVVDRWCFVRKPPGLRLRFDVRDDDAFTAAMAAWSTALPIGTVRAARRARYQPEEVRFGGAVGLALAHDLWCATAPLAVALEAADPGRAWRYPLAARAGQALWLGLAVEHAVDPWARLFEPFARMAPGPDPRTLEALTEPTGFTDRLDEDLRSLDTAFQASGRAAASAARSAFARREITTDPGQWVADVMLFQWNMFGLGLDLDAMASMLSAATIAASGPT